MNLNGHVPPHDLEAEVAVLGSMLLDPKAARAAAAILTDADFYRSQHATAFRVLDALAQDERAIDPVLFREELQTSGRLELVGGTNFISRIVAAVPSAANAEHYAKIVKDASVRRRIADAAAAVQLAELSGDDEQRARAHEELARAVRESSKPTGLRSVTLADLERMEIPEPEAFVADDLVVRGRVTLIVAMPKVGKSLTGLLLVKCIAAGMGDSWLGSSFKGKRAPTVYLTAEGGLSMAKGRSLIMPPVVEIADAHIVAERPFPKIDTPEGLAMIRDFVKRIGAGLLVIDPLAKFRDLRDENDNAEAQRLADGLCDLAQELGIAIVVIHHPSRAATAEGTSGSLGGGRGATALFGAVDVSISLRKDAKSGEIQATFEKRYGRAIEPGRRLRLDPETLILEFEGDLGDVTRAAMKADGITPARAKVSMLDFENALQPIGTWRTKAEILAALDLTDAPFRKHVKRWGEHLGDRLDTRRQPGPHAQNEYRLVPLDERAESARDLSSVGR